MSRFLAFIALKESGDVTGQSLLKKVRSNLADDVVSKMLSSDNADNAMLLDVDGVTVTVMAVDQPLPQQEYADPLSLERQWKDARDDLGKSPSHVIVSTLAEVASHEDALKAAKIVTIIVAAVTQCVPSIGVVWTNGHRVVPAEVFQSESTKIAKGELPFFSWVNLIFLRGPDTAEGNPTTAVLTKGMEPFIGREIEFLPTTMVPGEAAKRVIGLAEYLLQQGPIVGDGETIGLTQDEMINVSFADEGQRPDVPIMQLSVK